MQKRIPLNYETVKRLFDAKLEEESGESYFKINGDGGAPIVVKVPTSVMHRLFRLGQAYGLRQLRFLESETKLVIGTVDVAEFIGELRRLLVLLNDELLHEYVNRLLAALEGPPDFSDKSVAVSTGRYF